MPTRGEGQLSRTQRIVLGLMPGGWRASAEAESRQWVMTCPRCGATQSVWDGGGIRFKAKGRPWIRARCGSCGERSMQRLERIPDAAERSPETGPG